MYPFYANFKGSFGPRVCQWEYFVFPVVGTECKKLASTFDEILVKIAFDNDEKKWSKNS